MSWDRARPPDSRGHVTRDGVAVGYAIYGEGPVTVLLLPAWSLVHSAMWRGQVPYLARYFRVITVDPRGNGRSDRPVGAAAYADTEFVADMLAVLDATGTERAVLVGMSAGARWAIHVAADHPDRALGLFLIDPAAAFTDEDRQRQRTAFDAPPTDGDWRSTYNRRYWLEGDFTDFRERFTEQVFCEPHSSKQIEDALSFQAGVTPEMLVDTTDARLGNGAAFTPLEPLCTKVRCPVTVVHGDADRIAAPASGARVAELTGGDFVLLEGSGHSPQARDPVRVNLMIREFAERVSPGHPRMRRWVRAHDRPRRALFLSSPIGLGHAMRDLAIAREVRRRRPEVHIEWLTQQPVDAVLRAAGERVHPASADLASECGHLEAEAAEHDLHAFEAYRRMDTILLNNFHVFNDVVAEQPYDLVVGDEAWDVDYFLHENPELKRFGFAWLTDFVGMLPMPDGGDREAALVADYNAEMLEQRARYRRLRDASIFVGEPEDVVDLPFGAGLPRIRDWVRDNFDFAGYVTGFPPVPADTIAAVRRSLRLRPDDRLCVVAVGGTGVGRAMLERVLDAVPLVRRRIPDLHFLLVTGPRIDPRSLPRRLGVRVRGYLPRLFTHLAACDIAVVQGGLTTCMELTAAGTPFLYVPLQHHFEQQLHVPHRLDRYGAGRRLSYSDLCDPDVLADAIGRELAGPRAYRPVATDGAARAGAAIARLL